MTQHERSGLDAVSRPDFLLAVDLEAVALSDDGVFPNNAKLPLLVYPGAVHASESGMTGRVGQVLGRNRWGHSWVDGIYDFHHYHSTAHEVLVVCGGHAKVQFGGERGVVRDVSAGDAVVIPAGVAHKNLGASGDFVVVGAYPAGQTYDMQYGKKGERPAADRNIVHVPLPQTDPLYGPKGPLAQHWRA
jgi:uncharacterized protein YjlB